MMGLGYLSNQYYSYQNAQQLEQALQFNNIGFYEINDNEKIIKYTIDRKQCIRLSDLFFWIKIKFIKFNYGQLLDLFEKLLIHAQILEQQNIDFIYLDDNRIWLILEQQSQYLSIMDSILKYKVAFTGFQCPFYNKEDTQSSQRAIIQVHIILLNFLEELINGKIFMSEHQDSKNEIAKVFSALKLKLSKEDKVIKKLYEPLKEKLLNCKISDSLNSIKQLKKELKYDQNQQTIKYDKAKGVSQIFINQIKTNIESIINKYTNNQLLLEHIQCFAIQTMANQVCLMNLQSISVIHHDGYEKQFNQLQQQQLQELRESYFKQWTTDLLKKEIENYSQFFKFSFNEAEILQMCNDIFNELLNLNINRYFENSNWYFIKTFNNHNKIQILNQNLNKFQIFKKGYIQGLVERIVRLNIQIKILKALSEMI